MKQHNHQYVFNKWLGETSYGSKKFEGYQNEGENYREAEYICEICGATYSKRIRV